MLHKTKFLANQVFNDPRARVIFILSTLLLAALAGGAPSDFGGG